MNEMLGNQYFMARNYLGAATVFQNVLKEDPTNFNVTKKLIVALTQTSKFERATELFLNLIKEDINIILDTDPVRDDCPCVELAYSLEHISRLKERSFTTNQTLGILWLYCDINTSIKYFEKALELKPNDEKINAILIILKKKLIEISDQNSQFNLPS